MGRKRHSSWSPGQRRYICGVCGRIYMSLWGLKRHSNGCVEQPCDVVGAGDDEEKHDNVDGDDQDEGDHEDGPMTDGDFDLLQYVFSSANVPARTREALLYVITRRSPLLAAKFGSAHKLDRRTCPGVLDDLQRFVHCPVCWAAHDISSWLAAVTESGSFECQHVEYPRHVQASRRSPCGTDMTLNVTQRGSRVSLPMCVSAWWSIGKQLGDILGQPRSYSWLQEPVRYIARNGLWRDDPDRMCVNLTHVHLLAMIGSTTFGVHRTG